MDKLQDKCPRRCPDEKLQHPAASTSSSAYILDMSTLDARNNEKKDAPGSAWDEARPNAFGRAQPYFESIRNDKKDPDRVQFYFRIFFTLVYLLCTSAWIYWHLAKLDLPKDIKLSDWLAHSAVLAILRDYLLFLAGYTFLMSMMNLVLK